MIMMWAGASNAIPDGWYLCNGQNGTPDLRNKFVIASNTVGTTGGSNSITLTVGNLPTHSHGSLNTATHSHSINGTSAGGTLSGYTHSAHTFYGVSHSHSLAGTTATGTTNGLTHTHTWYPGTHRHQMAPLIGASYYTASILGNTISLSGD